MDDLIAARAEISDIDEKIAELFERRMNSVSRVAEYKKEHGLPVFDPERERELIERNSAYIRNPEIREYYVMLQKDIMGYSRGYQHRLSEGVKVAYSGIEGAFASIAAGEIFPDGVRTAYPDFESAYNSVVTGVCDSAALPVENSYAGEVGQVIDLIFAGDLFVTGVYELSVCQNLLGLPESEISDIKRVISHPQALAQCDGFIKSHGFEYVNEVNTAVAAQRVKKENNISLAAVASKKTAELYGLKVLAENINTGRTNTTKFAVLSRSLPRIEGDKGYTSFIMFTVKNEAGALAGAIDIIGRHGYNMSTLCSRPRKSLQWNYYFYAELDGNLRSPRGEAMTAELKKYCSSLKLGGVYSADRQIKTETEL